MVKIGKKLKGFDEGIKRLDTHKDREIEEEEKTKISYKGNKYGSGKFSRKTVEQTREHPTEYPSENNDALYLVEESILVKKKYNDPSFYLERNSTSAFLVLLLYKILIIKPDNIIEFILKELECLLKDKFEKSKKFNNISDNNNIRTVTSERHKDDAKNFIGKKFHLTEPKSTYLEKYKFFQGERFLSLDNLLEAVNFIKIENSDQVYFNSLLKIIKHFENSQNKDELLKENIQLNDSIPLNKAIHLTKTFYINYFHSIVPNTT
ncbi:uncharacterized protein MKS88_000040 [Plasmodium brasilianum]|uniref:Uncharacterized protein n=1 Tax=Plasmodium malariae TaxID=5858 RepID=A0A1A8VUY9_PLAMA|nr:conserved Plasmodium protein, unknown function [Plasmodium malariae]KAI4841502.1 hypothetical protein MKS88_000040 [Plasmodium brasilianum]SBS83167.1 hypothetical protein PMALA_005780 [Plasmodium malariae]SBT85677.1 conserved Plasmodium protein, unknown function [Plasmodium malariae]